MELTTNGLRLEKDADGVYWLHFGPYAMVNLQAIGGGPIVRDKIMGWARSQEPKP